MSYCFKCDEEIQGEARYGLHPTCFAGWFSCAANDPIRNLTPVELGDSDPIPQRVQSFLHGKFKKYTAQIGEHAYVLKVEEEDFPNLPRVEYVCNEIASTIGLEVPNYYFLHLEERDCFVSRNFVEGSTWQKLTHIYHYLDPKREFDVESIGKTIFRLTGKPQDVDQFHLMVLFDSLVGNHDRHGRNLGILSRGKTNRLGPIYDNPSYIGIETILDADLNPRGKIFTKASHEPTMKDYVLELKRLGAVKILRKFRRKCSLEEITHIVSRGFLDLRVGKAMNRLIQKRYEEFTENF